MDEKGLEKFRTAKYGTYIVKHFYLYDQRVGVSVSVTQLPVAHTATSTPLLKDLHNHITPHYAARWRVIGTLLGLPKGTLDIIKYDNRDKARPCCDAVLEEWLEVDPSASWNKLLSVIQSPAVSSDQATEKGD